MLECIIPEWIVRVFEWLDIGVSQVEINNMMNWMVNKGILYCYEDLLI